MALAPDQWGPGQHQPEPSHGAYFNSAAFFFAASDFSLATSDLSDATSDLSAFALDELKDEPPELSGNQSPGSSILKAPRRDMSFRSE
eukprot:CAMPEP_0175953330 /NCGR_PEP_ID=MMETSP0108-20121206/31293_1 /TAXON_ID=195067 ORGANISM="Goniomonas pacifica, Strain CCMP1869" /NCGR_SAMPLE_ID=MMETSP0108 /ASSEMBLY_ACC=CAM_ASM_000204 /LENGTH=87 /DNA_ID=CAMNT_0017279883 /DNA_START=106 /DNA_END=368 /DNA_ORIENTATION=+